MTPFSAPSSLSRATDRIVSIDSCFAASMKPQVLTTTTSASAGSRTICRPSSMAWPSSTSESTRLRAQPRLTSATRMPSFIGWTGARSARRGAARRPLLLGLLLHDPDLDRRLDALVQHQRHVDDADLLERLVELDLPLVDREALLPQRQRDLRLRDGTEQMAFLVGATLDRDRGLDQLLRQFLERTDARLFFGERLRARAFDLGDVGLGDHHGETLRQQVIARVAVAHLHHLADATEVLDRLLEQEFHVIASRRRPSGRGSARA